MDQIVLWLSLSPQQRKQWMAERLEVIELDDLNHPAFARFKAVYEPLKLRDKERALRFKKVRSHGGKLFMAVLLPATLADVLRSMVWKAQGLCESARCYCSH